MLRWQLLFILVPYNVINAIFKYNIHSATVAMGNMPMWTLLHFIRGKLVC